MSKSRPPQAGLSRKHLARAEREALMTKWIIGVTIAVAVLVIGLLGYGWLDQSVLRLRRPVARVGTAEISGEKFQKAVKYQRYQLIQQYLNILNYLQFLQSLGADTQTLQSYQQQASQIESQLNDSETLGRQTLDNLIEDEIVRQAAARRGITVAPDELEKAFQEAFGYYANGTPTPLPTFTPAPTDTPGPTDT